MHSSFSTTRYDVVVIGAGPAGLNAALSVSEHSNLSVLVLDKHESWNRPIACAEGVGQRSFERAVSVVQPGWIRQVINRACFQSPDFTCFTYSEISRGYIIDRTAMQRDLAALLALRGVAFAYGCTAEAVTPAHQGCRSIVLRDKRRIEARIIIDASGPLARLGNGEAISCQPRDLEPAYFIVAENVDIAPDTVHLHVGRTTAPGGYIWIFPRGQSAANIGIVIGSRFRGSINIRERLHAYVSARFPDAQVVERCAGFIPCATRRQTIAVPGFIKAGDAACCVNPVSRAGIAEALLSGRMAGRCAAALLACDNDKKQRRMCREYEQQWYAAKGRSHIKLAKVKHALAAVPDEDYNRAVAALNRMPPDDITAAKIFMMVLGRFPKLLWALRHAV